MNPNNIYVNLAFYCNKANPSDPDVPAVLYASRMSPILNNATQYEMSIARLDLETQNMPVLIPSIQNTPDVNLTQYGIKIKQNSGGEINFVYLEYVCQNKFQNNVPSSAGIDSPYYHIFNVQQVVDMFNVACSSAVSVFEGLNAPFMVYNNDNTFSIYFDNQFLENYNFYVNESLYNLFRNFNYTYYSTDNQFPRQLLVSNKLGLNLTTINSVDYVIETQNYNSFCVDWSPVSSIVMTSATLPIVQEEVISAINIIQNTSNSSGGIEPQITDICLSLENPNDYNNNITYTASTNYRRISLTNDVIQDFDIRIYWRSKKGLTYPILMSDNNSVSLKIKFEKI